MNTRYFVSRTVFLIGVICLLSVCGVYKYVHIVTMPEKNTLEFWQNEIRERGGRLAYAELAREAEQMSSQEQHAQAHFFGAALYSVVGESGLSICDSRFSFGCFHEFLGLAIIKNGLDAVSHLDLACTQALPTNGLSCQHGIGHGVMGALGYTTTGLTKALSICKSLPVNDVTGMCFGGVFMEYNTRLMHPESREKVIQNPAYPCDSVGSEYQSACFFWQPQRWRIVSFNAQDTPTVYAHLGEYCRQYAHTPLLLQKCYQGIGNIVIASAQSHSEDVRALCDSVSSDMKARVWCRAVGASQITGDRGEKEGRKVCEGLSTRYIAYCNAWAKGTATLVTEDVQEKL